MSRLDEEDRNAIMSLCILVVAMIVVMTIITNSITSTRFDALEAQIEELHR